MNFKYIILDDVVDELNQKRIEDLFLGDIPKWERIITTTPGAGSPTPPPPSSTTPLPEPEPEVVAKPEPKPEPVAAPSGGRM